MVWFLSLVDQRGRIPRTVWFDEESVVSYEQWTQNGMKGMASLEPLLFLPFSLPVLLVSSAVLNRWESRNWIVYSFFDVSFFSCSLTQIQIHCHDHSCVCIDDALNHLSVWISVTLHSQYLTTCLISFSSLVHPNSYFALHLLESSQLSHLSENSQLFHLSEISQLFHLEWSVSAHFPSSVVGCLALWPQLVQVSLHAWPMIVGRGHFYRRSFPGRDKWSTNVDTLQWLEVRIHTFFLLPATKWSV